MAATPQTCKPQVRGPASQRCGERGGIDVFFGLRGSGHEVAL